ncbi:MAG: alpha/beta hydrolase, partial [Deltaproteobacteria bacterium]|nr:alpha/beta hydrolase [Deltaproteobacteria bacterium]
EEYTQAFFGKWAIRFNQKQVFFDDDLVTDDRVTAYFDRLRTENAIHALVSTARNLKGAFKRYESRYANIDKPTLILWGENDIWLSKELGEKYQKAISGSVFCVLPECGHVPQEEKPLVTAGLMDDFLQGRLDPEPARQP